MLGKTLRRFYGSLQRAVRLCKRRSGWLQISHCASASRLRILTFVRTPFIRNLAAVAGGAAASQAITMALSPIITRLYGPEAYGLQGVFLSIAGVFGSISAMTYPVAIVLPKHDQDAIGLARLSIHVGIAMSLLVTATLYYSGYQILDFLKVSQIADFMYLIPTFMLFTALSAVINQWLIRKHEFSITAKVSVWQSFIINLIKVAFGFAYPTATVLIVTTTSGILLSAIMLFIGMLQISDSTQAISQLAKSRLLSWTLAKRHRDFPLLRAPQVLLNSVSQSLPIVMLAAHFGPTSAGFYTIASAALGIPTTLIGNSFTQVFYPKIHETINRGEDAKSMIIRTTRGLALTGAIPFITVIFAGPALFGFVFGGEWSIAGTYAQWLSAFIFFQFINKPAVAAIPTLGIQRGLLIYELFSTATKVLAIYIGYEVFDNDIAAIALFSIFGSIAYVLLITWVIFSSGKFANTLNKDRK